jgi:hypothetical protein
VFHARGAQIDDKMLISIPHSGQNHLENKARNDSRLSPRGENKAIGTSKTFLIDPLIA